MKLFKKIPLIMAEVGHISKDRRNQQQGYSFRGIDDLYQALQGPLAKHGVFFAPTIINQTREERTTKSGGALIYTILTVKFTFYDEEGATFECATIGEAMDSGDKSANKAMSAALKYALLQIFCIPTDEDNDPENHSPSPGPKKVASWTDISKSKAPDMPSENTPKKEPATTSNSSAPISFRSFGAPTGSAYVIPFGKKYKGLTLEQVGKEDLASFSAWLQAKAGAEGKPIDGQAQEFLERVEAYINGGGQ